jgi:hypothetical protein
MAYRNPISKSNVGHMSFENKGRACGAHVISTTRKWYNMMYGLGVFREGIILDEYIHGEICSQLFIQMNGCNILFSHNLWFKVIEIKTKQGLM